MGPTFRSRAAARLGLPWAARAALGAGTALVLLNASLTFENVWPTPRIRWAWALSVELAACVLLLAAAPAQAARLSRWLLPAAWVALVAGHYLDVTAVGLYGRDFNLYWDSQHLGNVAAMLARAAPAWLLALAIAGAVLALAGSLVLARVALGQVAAVMQAPAGRRVLGAVAAIVVVLFTGRPSAPGPAVRFADPVTPMYVRQARLVLAMAGSARGAAPSGPAPVLESDLGAMAGADVLLVFVESYGAVAFEAPAIAPGLAESRARLDAAVHETGRRAVSAYVDSPTFGGSSWLAHLSLLSGVDVRDQQAYTSLMASDRETMVATFARAGYRTVALMPGMRQAWPEGAFYGFDAIYGRERLEYQGPEFGWWSIPDQYALAKLDALERRRAPRAPVFVFFPTSTTHAPFGPVAPYQPDWTRVLTPDPYAADDLERAVTTAPDLMNLSPAYVRAMAYEFTALAGYLREHDGERLVMVLVGDHQPPAAVSGPRAPWHVPVHVISDNDQVIGRLLARGFGPGLEPGPPPIGPMHALAPLLLEAGQSPPATPQPRDVHGERPR